MRTLVPALAVLLAMPPTLAANLGVHNDFNGDGRSDLLWHSTTTGANIIWRSGNAAESVRLQSMVDPDWQIAGTGHLHDAQFSELLWRNRVTGAMELWSVDWFIYSGPLTMHWRPVIDWSGVGGDPAQWEVSAFGDEMSAGIFLRNRVAGANAISYSDIYDVSPGDIVVYRTNPVANLAWEVAGIGDFDGDGRSEVLWRNTTTGANVLWQQQYQSFLFTGKALATVKLTWHLAAVADFDGDGKSDIFWRNTSTGANVIWYSGKPSTSRAARAVTNQAWQVATTGDFDGDGRFDLFWRNTRNGANVIWKSANPATQLAVRTVRDQAWRPVK